MKRLFPFLLGSIFALALVATCGGHGSRPGGLPDLARGGAVADGAFSSDGALPVDSDSFDALLSVDSAHADAPGSMVYTGNCDQQYQYSESSTSYAMGWSRWFADLSIPGLHPEDAPHLSVIGCNPVCISPNCEIQPDCNQSTCQQTGFTANLRCAVLFANGAAGIYPGPTGIGIDDGRLVVDCGLQTSASDGYVTGRHYQTVYVRVN